jgi:hypothetical protein
VLPLPVSARSCPDPRAPRTIGRIRFGIEEAVVAELAELFELTVELGERLDMGAGVNGRRVLDWVRAGTFRGPRLRGTVLTGGDWGWQRPDRTQVIDARLVLSTDDGALIYMSYLGRAVIPADVRPLLADRARWHEVDPSRYYFRTAPMFETGSPDYAWLNDVVAVGHGFLAENGVGYRVSQLL